MLETAHKDIIDCVQGQFITLCGCFITVPEVSFALALRKRMNYLMASCTNKTFIVIYIRQNPGEIKSSSSIWPWNFAENRTCTVATNTEIKPSEDVLFLWSFSVYTIRDFSAHLYYCNLMNITDLTESSEWHSSGCKLLDFLKDILKLFS